MKAVEDQHAIVVIIDAQGRITGANDPFCALSQFSREELLGQVYHHDIQAVTASINQQGRWQGETEVRAKDGSSCWLAVTIVPLPDNPSGPVRFISIGTRIAAPRRPQAHDVGVFDREPHRERAAFINLFESLPGLYLVLTPDLKIVTASHAYLKATLTRAENIVGRGIFEVFPDDPNDPAATGVANLKASFDRVLQHAAADTMAIQKYAVERADGTFEERFWSPINSPIFGADRRMEYIVHRVEDVTDFVQHKSQSANQSGELKTRMEKMEAEIFQSSQKVQAVNRKLEEANKELEAFSYSVSHDLRAPLRAVDGFAQALLEDFGPHLPAEGQRQLNVIRNSAQRMGELIDGLLRFSQLGRQPLKRQPVDMDSLLRETLDDLKSLSQGRQIQITVGELPACSGDRTLLKQVWVNLVSNAIKYSRKRELAGVEIGLVTRDGEEAYFVRDNGSGFDMRYAEKLFGVFQRLHRLEDFEGTGVGLAIVQRIVQRHGGRVFAESEVDRGATFYFTVGKESTP